MINTLDQIIELAPSLAASLDDLGPVADGHADAVAQLKATNEALAEAKSALTAAKSELAAVTAKNKREYDQAIFDRRKQLEAVTAAIDKAKGEHADLTARINHALFHQAQIEASIVNLRKRARGETPS
jgi:predicted  nucleic acid-binding Zn-ribbon protein